MWYQVHKRKKKRPHSIILEGNHEHRIKRVLDYEPHLASGARGKFGISFKDLDFVFHEGYLSRNKCFTVRFSTDQKRPSILKVIEELDCSEYKH